MLFLMNLVVVRNFQGGTVLNLAPLRVILMLDAKKEKNSGSVLIECRR